ncbi:P-loop containing nucleoside triphosphate hydrolase protein [Piromyces finnis]|uniref:p-loop containing nucleoside triphosphate hydrolase protein n=1 Tax=Piromyces finnis TaxID=1754191 RepID=A0A1Y1VFS8_9FUNG|nr:P-loop containing nucleoside triphosphate hydrolase protein [Piromyces finnis]|eukprot:ORX54898.1 P-loop containing nucleoside triphosphate hydrolase protein [Piromyces finnis]
MKFIYLDNLPINNKILLILKNAQYETCTDILLDSENKIKAKTKLETEDIQSLLVLISKTIYTENPKSALEIRNENQIEKLSLGDKILNKVLGGGLPTKSGIIEIVGESAVGKSQLALQLCLMVQLPKHLGGLKGDALYLTTETFYSNRLETLKYYFMLKYGKYFEYDPCQHIFVETLIDLEMQQHYLYYYLPNILEKLPNIRLIIIDSIAFNFRGENNILSFQERAKILTEIAVRLKEISDKKNLIVICINQVSDYINDNNNKLSNEKVPTLGLTWSNCINMRIELSRNSINYTDNDEFVHKTQPEIERILKVIHSSYMPYSKCKFIIRDDGIKGII